MLQLKGQCHAIRQTWFKHQDIFASKKTKKNALVLLPIDHFHIPYDTLCLPPKFCLKGLQSWTE